MYESNFELKMELQSYESNPWKEDEERRYGTTRRLLSLAKDLGYKVIIVATFVYLPTR